MRESALGAIGTIMQEDVGERGLRADPERNLINACPHDFHLSCQSIAGTQNAAIAVITGFYIPHAEPPCGETDGPLGAVFLARALVPLGVHVALISDPFATEALKAGIEACGLKREVPVLALPSQGQPWDTSLKTDWQPGFQIGFPLTHLIALERVGPSHTPQSVRLQAGASASAGEQFESEVPPEDYDCCHTMRGLDITNHMAPAHLLLEAAHAQIPPLTTIGIGDGGNEIGMGKIPWEIIRNNIPCGGLTACRVPADYLIVCGVSNWGAYGLATGVRILRGAAHDPALFELKRERELLELMVERGPLVDGMSGKRSITVDGLTFARYAEALRQMGELASAAR